MELMVLQLNVWSDVTADECMELMLLQLNVWN